MAPNWVIVPGRPVFGCVWALWWGTILETSARDEAIHSRHLRNRSRLHHYSQTPPMSIARAKVRARSEPLDCVVRVVTPERITLVLPLAGPARRFVAYLIDQLLLTALILVTVLVFLFLSMGSRAGWADPGGLFCANLELRGVL